MLSGHFGASPKDNERPCGSISPWLSLPKSGFSFGALIHSWRFAVCKSFQAFKPSTWVGFAICWSPMPLFRCHQWLMFCSRSWGFYMARRSNRALAPAFLPQLWHLWDHPKVLTPDTHFWWPRGRPTATEWATDLSSTLHQVRATEIAKPWRQVALRRRCGVRAFKAATGEISWARLQKSAQLTWVVIHIPNSLIPFISLPVCGVVHPWYQDLDPFRNTTWVFLNLSHDSRNIDSLLTRRQLYPCLYDNILNFSWRLPTSIEEMMYHATCLGLWLWGMMTVSPFNIIQWCAGWGIPWQGFKSVACTRNQGPELMLGIFPIWIRIDLGVPYGTMFSNKKTFWIPKKRGDSQVPKVAEKASWLLRVCSPWEL